MSKSTAVLFSSLYQLMGIVIRLPSSAASAANSKFAEIDGMRGEV